MLLTIAKSFLDAIYQHENFFKFSLTLLFVGDKEANIPVVNLFENRTKELAVLLQKLSNHLKEEKATVIADCFFNGLAGYYISKKLYHNSYLLSMDDDYYISTFVDTLISGIEHEQC